MSIYKAVTAGECKHRTKYPAVATSSLEPVIQTPQRVLLYSMKQPAPAESSTECWYTYNHKNTQGGRPAV